MKSMQKLVIALVLTATSPFLIAANKGDQPMRHDHTVGDGHEVMVNLLKTGKVLSVTPMGNSPVSGSDVRTYEIKIKTPDGVVHSVEFLGAPVGVKNG